MLKKLITKPAASAPAPVASPAKAAPKKILRGGIGTQVAPDAKVEVSPATKLKIGTKVEPKENVELIVCISEYDSAVEVAEQKFVALVEYIQDNQIDKATVMGSMMKARGISYESALAEYSKMKKIFNNEEVLADLKAGKITMKVAREKVKDPTKKKTASGAKTENKDAKFSNTLKTFTAAAKESGYSLKEVMTSVEAELRSAGLK